MKFWLGNNNTDKAGQFGTMNDDGFVPDSTTISSHMYDTLRVSQIPIEHKKSDIEKLIEWAKNKGHI